MATTRSSSSSTVSSISSRNILLACVLFAFLSINFLHHFVLRTSLIDSYNDEMFDHPTDLSSTSFLNVSFRQILKNNQQLQNNNNNNNNTTTTNNDVLNVYFILTTDESSFRLDNLRTIESVFYQHPPNNNNNNNNNTVHVHLYGKATRHITTNIVQPLMDAGYPIFLHKYVLRDVLETVLSDDNALLLQENDAIFWFTERLAYYERIDPHWTAHEADVLRLILLYTMGGIYMDTDMIVVKPLSKLRNVIGVEKFIKDDNTLAVNNAFLAFDRGNSFVLKALEEMLTTFAPGKWGYNGPLALTRTLYKHPTLFGDCVKYGTSKEVFDKQHYNGGGVTCGTGSGGKNAKHIKQDDNDDVPFLQILPVEAFYPMHWKQVKSECFYTQIVGNGKEDDESSTLSTKRLWESIKSSSYVVHTNNHVAGVAWKELNGHTLPDSMCHWLYNSFCTICHGGVL